MGDENAKVREELNTLKNERASDAAAMSTHLRACLGSIDDVFNSIRARPHPRGFSANETGECLEWINDEINSFKGLLSAYGDYCTMDGAKAAAVTLEASGCPNIKRAIAPGFPVPSADEVINGTALYN